MSVKVGVVGATGYAGAELVRLLARHDKVELAAVSSVSFTGKRMSEIYPALAGICDTVLTDEQGVIDNCDVVFASLPHGLCEPLAKKCSDKGRIFIDLGADFRLCEESDYKQWYGLDFQEPALHKQAVYGIPELFRDSYGDTKLIANPGCYPTSVALGLYVLLKNSLIDTNSIIIDSKSGTSGAGRVPSQITHFPDCNENFSPYKVAEHRHTPEIEQTLSSIAGEKVQVTFVPHLLPVNRGILSTMYAKLKDGVTEEQVRALYEQFCANEQFVRLMPKGATACIATVARSNYCDISLHIDRRCGRIVVVSAIDNMVKGAAGQAIQNMNILLGIDEGYGLMLVPNSF